jgi:glycosyltransferase involved in cell wall biosynthesis
MGGVGQAASAVDIVHIVPAESAEMYGDAEELSSDQSSHWGFPVTARVLLRQQREKSFLNYYGRAIFSAAEHPAFLGVLDRHELNRLSDILKQGYDFILVHRLAAMCSLIRAGLRHATVIFDMDDVEHRMKLRAVLQPPLRPGNLISLAQIPALFIAERRGAALSKLTFVCSEGDRQKLRRLGFEESVVVVPNAVDIPPSKASLTHEPNLMFIGDFGYAPNREAAERLALRIFPFVRRAVPSSKLLLVGQRAERLDPAVAVETGVEVLGFVKDLKDVYDRSRVVCCPLLNGGGTRLKLIEGAAFGKAMVSTRVGAEGLTFKEGAEILIQDTDSGFADACVGLLRNDALCLALGDAAREKAIASYGADHVRQHIKSLIQQSVAQSR